LETIENFEHEIGNTLTKDSLSIKDLFSAFKVEFTFVKKNFLILLIFGIIGGVLGFLYAFTSKPVFKASISFVLEDEKSSGGGVGLSGALGLASSVGIDLGSGGGGAFSGANLLELMRSRTMVEKALLKNQLINGKSENLANLFIQFKNLNAGWGNDSQLNGLNFNAGQDRSKYTLQHDSILGIIHSTIVGVEGKGMLNVFQKDKKASIINLEVKATNETFAKLFVESLAKEVSQFYIETKSKRASMNVEILQKQADSIRNKLNEAITGVAQANDNIYNLNPALNVNRTPSSKRQIDVQANTAILTQLVANLEMAKVSLMKATPLIQVIDKPILPLDKDKVSKRKSLMIGGLVAGFIALFGLYLRRWYLSLIADL